MSYRPPFVTVLLYGIVCLISSSLDAQTATTRIDFSNDIRPLLSDTCFKCHGPDEKDRKADLRLDSKEAVFEEFETVVPGDLDGSELYQRIITDDTDALMPPPNSGRVLTAEQKDLIRRWIEEGATWEEHWSLIKPQTPVVPTIKNEDGGSNWARNPVDHFIFKKLAEQGLTPNDEAERSVLIRRVAFDLTGLPPHTELARRYLEMEDSDWYEQLVDELLASKSYGEHMARFWLDAARYGDTHGLHLDNYREMWPYRDWVINAFNENISYQQFTIEQLAGDLLPDSTDQQKIASGFNRAHITTSEGGTIKEEIYVRNVVDRVSTTSTVFLGLSVGCAQCHDHKFDPISQTEFYQMFAFFNNLTDKPMDGNKKDPEPVLRVTTPQQRVEQQQLDTELAAANAKTEAEVANYAYVDPTPDFDGSVAKDVGDAASENERQRSVWVEDSVPAGGKPEGKWEFVDAASGQVHTGENARLQESNNVMVQHFFTGGAPQLKVESGDRFFAHVYLDPKNPPKMVMLQFHQKGWEHRVYWGEDSIPDWGKKDTPAHFYGGPLPETGKWIELEIPIEKVGFSNSTSINGIAFTQFGGKAFWDSAGVYSEIPQSFALQFLSLAHWLHMAGANQGSGLPKPIQQSVTRAPAKRSPTDHLMLRNYFLQNLHPESKQSFAATIKHRDELAEKIKKLESGFPTTLVSHESEKIKTAYLLERGEYDQKRDPVERKTLAALHPFPDDAPNNRLGLAQWLVDSENPLTARVAINRFWQQIFGAGIVKTSEDFGAQGDVPSHPELLDWLAVDWMENDGIKNGWDIKRLMKTLVMSATYRQSSAATPELLKQDPENRLLARGPRFRLDAEMLRDQALAVSGLLVDQVGGPSVKPPQPAGLWFAVGYSGSNTVRFKKDVGHEKVHRRSLYTFWKRTSPPPQMNTFDAPSRESCSVRRERTNTPLQALLLMNDPQYVEASRYLAQHTLESVIASNEKNTEKNTDSQRIALMFETAIGRQPSKTESTILSKQLQTDRDSFSENPDAAKRLLAVGEVPANEQSQAAELAAWTMLANLIMNMDEFVTKN